MKIIFYSLVFIIVWYYIGSLGTFNTASDSQTFTQQEAIYHFKSPFGSRNLHEAVTLNNIVPNSPQAAIVHPSIYGYSYYGASGHQIQLLNNLSAVNPTYQQMVDFMKADQTDKIPYNKSSFVCGDFAERLHNNAEKAGYKCAFVSIYFLAGGYGHACNVFNTTDKGLVYVDCTGSTDPSSASTWDSIVIQPFSIGDPYRTIRFDLSYSFCGSMGIIKNYYVYW